MHVLLPLRSPGHGKTRLATALDEDDRAALVTAMFTDVVAAVRAADLEPVVLASGPAAVAASVALGCAVLPDAPGAGLNAAIAAATADGRADEPVLVLQADLPMLQVDDVLAVRGSEGDVVLVPTDDGGTAALLRRPGSCMGTDFGRASAAGHRQLAIGAGLALTELHRPGMATDLDTPADLLSLDPTTVGPTTARVVSRLRVTAARRRDG